MGNDSSRNILEFYMKNNDKKYRIVDLVNNRQRSVAEFIVQACINAMLLNTKEDFDLNKVIRMIFAINFTKEDLDSLKDKNKYLKLAEDYYRGNSKESLMARKSIIYTRQNKKTDEEELDKINEIYEELRNVERKGHIYWNVRSPRLESVLEHIYGTIILTLGIESELNYCLDYNKTIKMLLVHDTAETIIGDLTAWDITESEKRRMEEVANREIFGNLKNGEELISLTKEFDKKGTHESEYAYLCDKLDYDLQVKSYELQGLYDFENRPLNVVTQSRRVKEIINNGANTVFQVHYDYDEDKYNTYPCIKRILFLSKDYQK